MGILIVSMIVVFVLENRMMVLTFTWHSVDDMLITAKDKSYISELKELLSKEFEIKDLGAVKKRKKNPWNEDLQRQEI